jgi:protease-4
MRTARIVGLVVGSALLLLAGGCMSVDLARLFEVELEEQTVQARAPGGSRGKVLIVDVSGFITGYPRDGVFAPSQCSPDAIKAVLNRAERDPRIKAVLLRLDTPGGEVTATDMIYREIQAYAARTEVPVHAVMLGLACSGGYYIACAADRVTAHPTTVTGSIGIIARFPKLYDLADKVGYREEIITSGKMKAMGHPLREMTPETRAVMQAMIDGMYDRFVAVVEAGRPVLESRAAVEALADGRVYTADQALAAGLVDEVGYLDDALTEVQRAAGIRGAEVVTYTKGTREDLTVYSAAGGGALASASGSANPLAEIARWSRPGFYYLWMPAAGR